MVDVLGVRVARGNRQGQLLLEAASGTKVRLSSAYVGRAGDLTPARLLARPSLR